MEPKNPGSFRIQICNCPEYRRPGVAPAKTSKLVTADTWPVCPWGQGSFGERHDVNEVEEDSNDEGTTIRARCCGRTESIFVPKGFKLRRTMFGLRLVNPLGQLVPMNPPVAAPPPPPPEPSAAPVIGPSAPSGLLEID